MRFPVLLSCLACGLAAHPMGNFSVSHYTRLSITPTGADGVYALDLAELPSLELMQKWKAKDTLPQAAVDAQAREWMAGLRFAVDGKPVTARLLDARLTTDRGAGNMPVLRVTSRFVVEASPGIMTFEDSNYPQSNGWKEIVISGAGVRKASQGAEDRSNALTAYPNENDPPQQLRARVEWSASPATGTALIESIAQPAPVGQPEVPARKPLEPESNQGRLAKLIEEGNLGPLAFLLAFVLGCAHAMTPGHGKTMVAAYLVGERGTAGQAVLLGLIVTVTHTLSVFALGIGMYFFAGKFAPERVTKLLEFVSGAAIAVLGLWLLYRRGLELAGRAEAHSHTHDYGGGSLWALGASGGIVPCPSALVLLLAAISLGRIGFGLVLLVVFSLGLATVLIAAGLLVVSGKRLLPVDRVLPVRYLPVISAAVITVIGVALTLSALQVKVT